MAIKNLMEDIVTSVVREVLKKEKEIPRTEVYEQDIIAYVMNRVPPRYITSERGVIHGKLETRFKFQQRTDILFLIHEALQTIKKRRASSHSAHEETMKKSRVLPHVMGEVLEETTFSIVPDVEVTLVFNGRPARMIDESWENPYMTNRATKGYFHFWPEFTPGEMAEGKDINFKLTFKSPRFNKKEVDVTLKVLDTMNLYESRIIPITLLQIKEGVDISFLYE
jgi:competence protein ComFB